MTDPRHAAMPVVLEALLRLEERDQVPAPTTLVRAVLARPIFLRPCAVLEVAQLEGLVTFHPPGDPDGAGWKLTEDGRTWVRARRT